ncbi:S1 family peptidase [Rubellimicrobium rubrum]|uniref:S1 family peptidase n=1 Tax=Rubellimicrobium rubrum TaxID=2585369 RepID=UPI00159B99B1|nr:serine protease [Rubellimicrobium rubrum]
MRISEDGKEIGNAAASGFYWTHAGNLYLVTNWHVVTGVNPDTGISLGPFSPNALRVTYFAERRVTEDSETSPYVLASFSAIIELDPHDPIQGWLIHPKGKTIDLAALQIAWDQDTGYYPNCLDLTELTLETSKEVGDDVFIIGFPEGSSFNRRLPMWKRGSIATDPGLSQDGKPQYYVDTIGNAGLSGAPVIHVRQQLDSYDAELGTRYKLSKKTAFAGVYAGRLGDSGLRSQIGRVFHPDTLAQIFEGL